MRLTNDQNAGARFLARSNVAMLADVPGFGKSAQVVKACDLLNVRAATALLPNRTIAVNFAAEFEKWSLLGHELCVLRSSRDPVPETGIVFTTYSLASREDVAAKLRRRKVDALICDEAHALKTPDSKRTKTVMRKAGLLGSAARLWLLTGTPAPNHSGELFVFAKVCGVWPGTYRQFIERFCELHENTFGLSIKGSKNHAELKALLAPFILRRDKIEGRPPLTINQAYVEAATGTDPYESLGPEDRAAVEAAIATGNWALADIPAVATVRRAVGLAKADGVAELANAELEAGYKKILVFCWHTAVIERIASKLPGSVVYDGRTPQAERERIYKAFQTDGGPRAIVAQIVAGSEGLNLTKANRVLIAEPSWTPDKNEQAICRAWRRGQAEPVLASFVALKGSLDARITAALHRKTTDVAQLI